VLANVINATGLQYGCETDWYFPIRIEETPDLIEQDFEEAAVMFNKSPGAAAALIHVCVQSLMPLLREQGKNLDDNISSVVRKGLEVEIHQAMDVLQVIYNNTGQLSHIDLSSEKAIGRRFFELVKLILHRRMLKKLDET
jgi:hypothetical protein